MQRTADGLEYEVFGSGDPLLLIHGSFVADALRPLAEHPTLTEQFSVVHYHRRGFGGSAAHRGPFSVEDQARDARAVLDALKIESAFVAGHSYGGLVGVQLSVDAPTRVRALVVMEPAIYAMKASWAEAQRRMFGPLVEAYRNGHAVEAAEQLMEVAAGAEWREHPTFKDALAQAAGDLGTFVDVELPALLDWVFTPAEAERIGAPVRFLPGGASDAIHTKVFELFASWLPSTSLRTVDGAQHSLNVTHTASVAAQLVEFFKS